MTKNSNPTPVAPFTAKEVLAAKYLNTPSRVTMSKRANAYCVNPDGTVSFPSDYDWDSNGYFNNKS
jgi:hypothetical protein